MDNNKVDLAISIAKDAHHTDRYGKHSYFDYHIEGVVSLVKFAFIASDNLETRNSLVIVAYLHDVLEDHPDVVDFGMLQKLFSLEIAEAISAISKKSGQSTDSYLETVRANNLARQVKIADSTFNMYNCIIENSFKRAKKYAANIDFLSLWEVL